MSNIVSPPCDGQNEARSLGPVARAIIHHHPFAVVSTFPSLHDCLMAYLGSLHSLSLLPGGRPPRVELSPVPSPAAWPRMVRNDHVGLPCDPLMALRNLPLLCLQGAGWPTPASTVKTLLLSSGLYHPSSTKSAGKHFPGRDPRYVLRAMAVHHEEFEELGYQHLLI